MTWKMARWVWKLESPLYLGMSPAGALNRTRLYIPARTMLGALAAEIARRRNRKSFPHYGNIVKELLEKVRLSYLYPAEKVGQEWKAWLPKYEGGRGLVWESGGNDSKGDRQFRRRLLTTRLATAIDHRNQTAEEGSLRETEVINPFWNVNAFVPVGMMGYVFWKNDHLKNELCEINEIFVGGDTRYGLGRLKKVEFEDFHGGYDFFGNDVEMDNSIRIKTKTVYAHATIPKNSLQNVAGTMECLTGWDRIEGGLINGQLLWAPGTTVNTNSELCFEILEYGIWKLTN